MRLGISMPFRRPNDEMPSVTEVMERARLIERAGFDGIWFGESISRRNTAWPDVLMWLTVAAAATERIELGTAILQVPLRYPVELAQRLLTLHGLSGGRFTAGLGAGSTKTDFDAVGVDFSRRFQLLAEGLSTIRALCRGEQVGTASLRPWPNTLGGPPIVIGSWESGIWVRKAATDFDGWMGSGRTTLKALKEGINRFRDAGGKRAMVVTIQVDLSQPNAKLADDENFHLRCGPEEAAERLYRLAELGYDDACVTRLYHTAEDMAEEDLAAIRQLVKPAATRA